MSTEENKALARSIWEAFASGDLNRLFDSMSDQIVWTVPETTPAAWGLDLPRVHNGKQAVATLLVASVPKFFPEGLKPEIHGIYGDGGTVVTELTFRGKLVNGGCYENDYCFVAEIKDGKIVRIREYLDTQKFKDVTSGVP